VVEQPVYACSTRRFSRKAPIDYDPVEARRLTFHSLRATCTARARTLQSIVGNVLEYQRGSTYAGSEWPHTRRPVYGENYFFFFAAVFFAAGFFAAAFFVAKALTPFPSLRWLT